MSKSEKLVRFGVAMPEQLLEKFDKLVAQSGLPNRSIALRHLVRYYIASCSWHEGTSDVSGSITLLYNHHTNDVVNELMSIQHDFGDVIICTTHVHVSHDSCLECLVVKGAADRLKSLETALNSLKGVHSINAAIATAII